MNVSAILRSSWQIYRRHLPLIFLVVAIVWIPFDLLLGYMDTFVFHPDDFLRSYRFARSLENTVGLVCVGALIQVTIMARMGDIPKFSSAMSSSLRLWGWMFWTQLLMNLAIVVGFLALILPAIFLGVRLCVASQVVIVERHFGTEAMRRSFALTRGHFWELFIAGIIIYFVFFAAFMLLTLLFTFLPGFEHWLIQSLIGFVMHLCYPFVTIAFTEIYLVLKSLEEAALVEAPSETAVHEVP